MLVETYMCLTDSSFPSGSIRCKTPAEACFAISSYIDI